MSIQRATNSYKFNKKQTNMTNKIKKLTDKKKQSRPIFAGPPKNSWLPLILADFLFDVFMGY